MALVPNSNATSANDHQRRYKYSYSAWKLSGVNPKDAKASDLGDLDLKDIFPVLVASCIMLTPILNWSVGVREHARAVTFCWGMLVFAAVVPTFRNIWEGVFPVFVMDQLATCSTDDKKNCTLNYVNSTNFTIVSQNFYDRWVHRKISIWLISEAKQMQL